MNNKFILFYIKNIKISYFSSLKYQHMQQKDSEPRNKKEENKSKAKSKNNDSNKYNLKKTQPSENADIQLEKMKQYFTKIKQLTIEDTESKKPFYLIDDLHNNIANNIVHGNIKISDTSKNIQTLLKSTEAQIKISPKDLQIYQKQAKRIQHLKLIASINKQLTNKPIQQRIPYIFSKQDHQRKITQIIEQKQTRERKIKQLKKIMKEKQQSRQKQQIEELRIQKQKQKQKKKQQISQKIMKQKEEHIHFLSQQIKHKKDFEHIINRVPLHSKMEQKFRVQVQIPQFQQKIKQHQMIKEFKQKYGLNTIKRHQSQYLNRKNESLSQSKMESRVQRNFKIKLPEKSQKLQSLLAQQILKNKMIWTQRELYIEQKVKRQQNYLKKLKEQHQPKIDLQKKSEIQSRIFKQKEHLSKIGLNRDTKKIGCQYLSEVKKIVKKKKEYQTEYLDQYHSQTLAPKRSFSQQSFVNNLTHSQSIEKLRQNKLNKLLNSSEDPESKYSRLQSETKKLEEIKQRKFGFLKHNFSENGSKQISNLALNNIKAKMVMMEIIQNKQMESMK